MLGRLIDSLDNPETALRLLAALDEPVLVENLAVAASSAGRPVLDVIASTVRGFLETASDDHWVQLIGIMNRAKDPGLAAVRAILTKALQQADL
jgi:hypothetical protein